MVWETKNVSVVLSVIVLDGQVTTLVECWQRCAEAVEWRVERLRIKRHAIHVVVFKRRHLTEYPYKCAQVALLNQYLVISPEYIAFTRLKGLYMSVFLLLKWYPSYIRFNSANVSS